MISAAIPSIDLVFILSSGAFSLFQCIEDTGRRNCMTRDFLQLWFFSVLWKKALTFNLEFSAYISISLAAKEWKTCSNLSLYTFTLCGFKGLVNPENMSFCCLCIFVSFGGGQC